MAKGPQILTASRLRDGAVLYWHDDGWVDALAQARVFPDPAEAKTAQEAAQAFVTARKIVNLYLFEVRVEDGQAVPVKAREVIRAAGPTVRRDLGKQAEGRYTPPPVHEQVHHAEHTPGNAKDPFDASV